MIDSILGQTRPSSFQARHSWFTWRRSWEPWRAAKDRRKGRQDCSTKPISRFTPTTRHRRNRRWSKSTMNTENLSVARNLPLTSQKQKCNSLCKTFLWRHMKPVSTFVTWQLIKTFLAVTIMTLVCWQDKLQTSFITAALRVVDVKVYESKEGLEVIVIKKINMQHCLMQASWKSVRKKEMMQKVKKCLF